MSNLYIMLALLGTFGAVALAGVGLELSRAQRSRTTDLLESQVGSLVPDLRQRELSQPLMRRALLPFVSNIGSLGRRLTPVEMRKRIAHKLVLAGSPAGWDADKVAVAKVGGLAAGAVFGVLFSQQVGISGLGSVSFIVLLTGVGYMAPDTIFARKAEERQKAIRRALPDTMDLLTISVEAGLGFDSALAQVVHNVPGELSEELARMLQEMQLGVSRADAFRHLADRTDVDEMNAFVLAMVQADVFGISVSKVLRAQAKELRIKRRQNAERAAQQIPLKILFPMIFCVMPALLVVVLGPGAIRIFENFKGI
jgi:tight adherence protein C